MYMESILQISPMYMKRDLQKRLVYQKKPTNCKVSMHIQTPFPSQQNIGTRVLMKSSATHCNTLECTGIHCNSAANTHAEDIDDGAEEDFCNTLQHT